MKYGIRRTVAVMALILALVMSCVCTSFGATGTKSSKKYETIKKGKYVYCSVRTGIYRVNIKTGSKKLIYKEKHPDIYYPGNMILHKGYLYFTDGGAITEQLYRVKTNGKNKRHIGDVYDFAISKGRIYYTTTDRNYEKELKKSMRLNGTNKKKSSYKVNSKDKKTNKKGYYVKMAETVISQEYDAEYDLYTSTVRVDCYLVIPGKTIMLTSYTYEE